jgi:glycosyltransferase involved in cell wall biosynthesis
MRVVILGNAANVHTVRWANGLSSVGLDVHLISKDKPNPKFQSTVSTFVKDLPGTIGYLRLVPHARKLIHEISPDVLSVHYASGYGFTARQLDWHPYLLSVWGSDVYDVPEKTFVHRRVVAKNLDSADGLASTSWTMAYHLQSHFGVAKAIAITPFGAEIPKMLATERRNNQYDDDRFTVGTVKWLHHKYGVDTLIEAFALFVTTLQYQEITGPIPHLRIVGDGPDAESLIDLTHRLGIRGNVDFVGRVPHHEVSRELNKMDVFVALSRLDSESFGVAVVEASAAGLPVIVSDAGGLPEVVLEGTTGYVVTRDDSIQAADRLMRLYRDPALRYQMGHDGYQRVAQKYSWSASVQAMNAVLQSVANQTWPKSPSPHFEELRAP